MPSYEEAFGESVKYFGGDELAAKVFLDKYALRDNDGELLESTPYDMHVRIAKELARVEARKFKIPLSYDEIFACLDRFSRIVPQGSPMYGIGNPHQLVSLSNCFVAGTRVLTDKGVKPIESVDVGDRVVTHRGRFRSVSQIHKNPLGGRQVFAIKCYRTPEFKVTGNHEVLSISQEQVAWGDKPSWNPIEYLRNGDYVAIPSLSVDEGGGGEIDLAVALTTTVTDGGRDYRLEVTERTAVYLHDVNGRQGTPVNRFWRVDEDFAYFLGLWYGDGCVFGDGTKSVGVRDRARTSRKNVRGITFTLNAKEKNLIDFVAGYGQKLFGLSPDINNNSGIDGSVQVVFHSTTVGAAFETMFGRGCRGKSFYTPAFEWPNSLVDKLVLGLIDSDGCVTTSGDLRVVMTNGTLLESFYHLLRSRGNIVGFVVAPAYEQYRLDFGHYSRFLADCGRVYDDDRINQGKKKVDRREEIEIDGVRYVRISRKVRAQVADEFVYTLGVEEDHSYAIEGVVAKNCYVLRSPLDSYGGILRTDQEMVQISKRRGGVGLDISNLRPSGSATRNAARTSTGIVPFMERFSNAIREVGQNGRRGASLVSISVHHPQVLDFATAKKDLTKVTGANISVRLSDEFLRAVESDSEYEQRWPVDSNEPKIRRRVPAREVWRTIIETAHATAEPGLLFWDNIIRESPADCYEGFETISTNPCSELPLSACDSCRLLLLNLFTYVNDPFTPSARFDFERFRQDAMIAQRFMDDIVDLELEAIDRILAKVEADPEPDDIKRTERELWEKIRWACENGRRTGTGITALGDTLAALDIKYGSDESIEMTGEIYKALKLACYRSSVEMAKELGPFPVWDYERERDNPFLRRILDEDPDLYEDMWEYGRRNISLLTTAPAGSVSIETQTSSGIEPVFMLSYTRRKKVNPLDQGVRVDFVDQNGDSWQEFTVHHPKFALWMQVTGESDPARSPYAGATAEEIDWRQRVRLQSVANTHVDHSISSTINLPEDVSVDQVAEIYETAWKSGCKGITVYRKNCRTGVLVEKKEDPLSVPKTTAPKRPTRISVDVYHPQCGGKRYFVVVGLLGDDPYEVIAGEHSLPHSLETGVCCKVRKGVYRLEDNYGNVLLENAAAHCTDDQEALLRMVSMSLRHGADLKFVEEQLRKVRGNICSFAKCLARVLKKYIPDGEEVRGESCGECGGNLVRQEGCQTCPACGWSKCA